MSSFGRLFSRSMGTLFEVWIQRGWTTGLCSSRVAAIAGSVQSRWIPAARISDTLESVDWSRRAPQSSHTSIEWGRMFPEAG